MIGTHNHTETIITCINNIIDFKRIQTLQLEQVERSKDSKGARIVSLFAKSLRSLIRDHITVL